MRYDAKLLSKLALIFFGLLFMVCIWLGRRQGIKNAPEGDKITVQDVEILLEALNLHMPDGEDTDNGGVNLTYHQYMDLYRELEGETIGLSTYTGRYEPDHEMLKSDWYEAYRILLAHRDTESSIWETTVFVLKTDGEEKKVYTQNGVNETPYTYHSPEFERNILREMRAYVKGNELLTVIEVLPGEYELKNVWVMESTNGLLQCFYRQTAFQIETQYPVEREKIADLTFQEGRIVHTKEKNEKIHGKLLWVSEDEIEIEGSGVYPIGEDMEVYKLYGDLRTLKKKDLKIGYEDTDYVMDKGTVCACLVSEKEAADRIRVLIKNTAKNSNFHDKAELIVDDETVQIRADDLEIGERRTYRCGALTDKILLNLEGIKREDHAYRGSIECYRSAQGMVLINELPLEEYLYAVVPSEMPASYPKEALKAQAVCARTYAYLYILHAGLPELGAHVDDTTSYQVYHNSSENAATTTAVKETDGMLLTYQGEPAQNYYYSTSCGVGTDTGVWKFGGKENVSYMQSTRMNETSFKKTEDMGDEGNPNEEEVDLRDEEQFRQFITSTHDTDLEKDEPWYRWTYTVDRIDTEAMLSRIAQRYHSSPESILTKTEGDYYVSQPIERLGKIREINITERGPGGVADELLILTDTGTYKILAEYNIRFVLCDGVSQVVRQDQSAVAATSLLPSGFFVIESGKDGEDMVGYTLIGGGYGHGVGMSQNGARALGGKGVSYQSILEFFFAGCQVEQVSTKDS